MLKKLFLTAFLAAASLSYATDKMYIDDEELCTKYHDSFYIHLGHNVWVKTDTVHRDKTGMFCFESSLCRSVSPIGKGYYAAYEKQWKCPYCYHYWPIGTSCQNKDCPSKYK